MKLLKNETIEKNSVKLTIEIDKEAFDAAVMKSYKKNVKKIITLLIALCVLKTKIANKK